MDEMLTAIDWSRAQFAMTAMYHWLFVPLTLGLGLIVAIMETVYVRKKLNHGTTAAEADEWLDLTKFWMRLFGVNFAIGVASGIILEFEFGTNWSNYSWFVGDVFGAPLAIEGIFAFLCESTFFAVMFFGWEKFGIRQHCAATWLTAFGATLSAWWILVANSWMQHPVGMEFDPDQMRNVMSSFKDVALSATAINKFCHVVTSSWSLGACFVISVCGWYLLKGRNTEFVLRSMKVAALTGLAGIIGTMITGDSSAVQVTKDQPMKLAAMEGLYEGRKGTDLIGFGIPNPDKRWDNDEDAMLLEIKIPKGLSILGRHDPDAFIPGIKDIIEGRDMIDGKEVNTVNYNERILRGRIAQKALRDYGRARECNDKVGMKEAREKLEKHYRFFGYGYFGKVDEAVPSVAMTFYPFHIMVILGGWMMVFLIATVWVVFRRQEWMKYRIAGCQVFPWLAVAVAPIAWVCSQCGWIVAEVGRQPWAIQDIMPVQAAISSVGAGNVKLTFFIFLILFTCLLLAEIGIMTRQIKDKK